MADTRIKTLLIEDSDFMRRVITDIITADGDIDLIGTAANGKEGSEMALRLKPDVVVTDMIMPEYDGTYVVRSVMENCPMPIILLSSLDKTNSRIFDALEGGAFEFIDKPAELDPVSIKSYRLLPLIKEASRADISLLKARQLAQQRNTNAHTFTNELHYEIVVIGASTGGPGALESIIIRLPENLKIPVVVAQHMPARFLETFASRLNVQAPLEVKIAGKGEVLRGGVIYIAPGEANLSIERSVLHGKPTVVFTHRSYPEFNNPSVNCLFESVARIYGAKCMGVILTGMGKDGTAGMLKIKEYGGFTIAQDERSSVVYGMPKSAIEAGAVRQVVSLKEMPGFIVSSL